MDEQRINHMIKQAIVAERKRTIHCIEESDHESFHPDVRKFALTLISTLESDE